MVNILLLLMLILILLIISYLLNNQDLFSPSTLMCIGFVIAVTSAMMNINTWGIDLHLKTIAVIGVGMISFLFGELFVNKSFKKKLICKNTNFIIIDKLISIANYKIIIISIYDLIVIFLYYKEVIRIASLGNSYWQSIGIMTAYKMQSTYSTDMESQINSLIIQLSKITNASAYVFLFVFINNMMIDINDIKKKLKYNFKILVPILLNVSLQLLKGVRIPLITMVVSALFINYFFWHRKVGWNKNLSFKYIKTGIISSIAFLFFFFMSKELVGRVSNANFFEYITSYTGGSIQLLDMYIADVSTKKSNMFLGETLPGLMISLRKLGLVDILLLKQLEFRTTNTGIYLGNVYTAFRRYYNDFGWYGLIIFPSILSCLLTNIYNRIKCCNKLTNKVVFRTIIYSYILFVVPTMAMEDSFYINISAGFFIEIIVFYFCIWFLLKCNIHIYFK